MTAQRSGAPAACALLAVAWVACGGSDDPCASVTGSCVRLQVTSPTVRSIDQLAVDVLYGSRHATVTDDPHRTVALPVSLALEVAVTGDVVVKVGAAGKLAGMVLGTGAGALTVADGAHVDLKVVLTPPAACMDQAHYCGGDKVVGDPATVYACNPSGAPIAHGTCPGACLVRQGSNDECAAVGGTCADGGQYCGGDKLTGDPSTLYSCSGGVGTFVMFCASGCVVNPSPYKDACR